MGEGALAETVRAALNERGFEIAPDELEEIAAAYAGLSSWIATAERLAEGAPAFASPLR